MNNVNTYVGNISVGEQEYTFFGKPTIMESLRGLKFQISANSFFQTNTHQAEILYKLIENCFCLKGDGSEIVLDLFCGTGTIGLTLAKKVKHVYGFEIVDQAVTDARRNANLNGVCNATFVQGDLNKIGDNFGEYFPKPDVVITDPNRPGMHMKLIKFLLNLKAARIVYVSYNPATCARDLDVPE
ncbi:RNA methyltransferase family protein [Perilla frutescens var. frutescens]|nr:RNA methyltransferase family protein [Perilla frutescens var. frutescens]